MDETSHYLEGLEPFFAAVPADGVPEMLRPIAETREVLHRAQRRVVFLGAVKTGKSSILNALLGAPVLPVLPYRTLPAVTAIRYGPEPSATVRRGAAVEEVPFDGLRALARDLDHALSVSEIGVSVPHPLLANGAVLVDTPGLLGSDAMDEAAYRELSRADLAVVVLAGDKILSAGERSAAALANDLLHGNVVFAVNRLDLVDEDELDDVTSWAAAALRDLGNHLVGRARIFAVSAARDPGSGGPGVGELAGWLGGFLRSEASASAALLARLGTLERRLHEAAAEMGRELESAAGREEDARRRYNERVMTERAAMRRAIAEGRSRVEGVRRRLPELGEAFVAGCVAGLRAHPAGRSAEGTMREQFATGVDRYGEAVRDEVTAALFGVPVTAPAFELGRWILEVPVPEVSDPARELGRSVGDALTRIVDGGQAGREAGAAIGGWIGKNILGVDLEAEMRKRVEGVARGTLQSISAEAQRYLAGVLTLLDEADGFYSAWTPSSREVEAAEGDRRYWAALLHWCEGFLKAVERVEGEVSVAWEAPE